MRSLFLIPVFLITCCSALAQTQGQFRMLNNQAFPPGTSASAPKYDYVKGNAYAFEGWKKADLTLQDGKVFKDLNIKLNLVDDNVVFEGPDQKEMILNMPLSTVTFIDGTTYQAMRFNNVIGLVEVLEKGSITLFKSNKKTVMESKGYNEVTEKRFNLITKYYLSKGQEIQEIKLDKKSISNALATLGLASPAADEGKANLKKEGDLVAYIKSLNQVK